MRDLVTHTPDSHLNHVALLKLGRHFRLFHSTKAVVGRHNGSLQRCARP